MRTLVPLPLFTARQLSIAIVIRIFRCRPVMFASFNASKRPLSARTPARGAGFPTLVRCADCLVAATPCGRRRKSSRLRSAPIPPFMDRYMWRRFTRSTDRRFRHGTSRLAGQRASLSVRLPAQHGRELSATIDERPPPGMVASTAARYNPLYYLAVGSPSLLAGPAHASRLMRLLSAALSALFLSWHSPRRYRAPTSIAASTVLLAATPMVLFLGAAINPNGLEITAAICSWTCGNLALAAPDPLVCKALLRRRPSLSSWSSRPARYPHCGLRSSSSSCSSQLPSLAVLSRHRSQVVACGLCVPLGPPSLNLVAKAVSSAPPGAKADLRRQLEQAWILAQPVAPATVTVSNFGC